MPPQTRSASSSPVKKSAPAPAPDKKPLNQRDPLRLFILPQDASDDAKFVTLPHPRDKKRKRFFFCSEKGLYDITKVSSTDPRSVILSRPEAAGQDSTKSSNAEKISDGYINKTSDVYITTPFDPAFLLLPMLPSTMTGTTKSLFQPLDDLLENHVNEDSQLRHVIRKGRKVIEEAISGICDTIEAGDEKMFRVNEDKILQWIVKKSERLIANGLPPSLEDNFVTRPLEPPMLSVKREEKTTTIVIDDDSVEQTDSPSENIDSQSTTASSTASAVFSEIATTSSISTPEQDSIPSEIKRLQRLRTALNFILFSYFPENITKTLKQRLSSSSSPIDFKPLDDHLSHLATLKAEALAMHSLGDFSRKRTAEEEDAAEIRAEKKRKLEEDEKRKKAGESRGVRDLKKVNVTGMKKMSHFFAAKPAAKAKS